MNRLYSGVLPFSWFILQICFSPILSQSHYSIVAPGTILSNRNYSVCVSLHDAPTPATLRLSIHSPNRSMHISQDVTLQPFETKMVNFMPPKLNGDFQYELKAEGINGLTLDDSKKLYPLQSGGPRIYIESDKALYKPGDTVQFRVIILNEHLRVTNIDEAIRIQILDPENNRIKQLTDIRLDRGVLASKFKLSQQPILGKWTILVHIGGKYDMKKEYTFKAEKYVLPKFSVHIEHDQNLVESDRVVRATIYGKYTYGKYVQGTLEVLLLDFMRSFDYAIKQTIEIDNGDVKANIAMDIGDLGYSQTMYLNATLREKHTNVTATAETKINIQSNKYRLIVPDSGIEFRDGKPYRLQLHVQHWNGTAVRDRTTPAKMHLQGKEYPANLDDNGVAHFDFEFQPIHWYGFSYKKSILTYDNKFIEQASYDVDENNCHLVMQPRSSADLTEPIEIDVSSNRSIPYLMYTLSGHGNIIQKEFIQLSPNQKSHRIRIKASIAMIPNSYLFVYYILNDQLNFCELTIRLPKIFENQLTLSAPTHVKPGQNITMNIKGQPNSRVSILAVDKSVLLLSSENVLQKESIMRDLLFDRAYRQQYPNDHTYEYTPGHTSGLIIMTNAKYRIHTFPIPVKPWPSSYYPPIRTLFPETWIFKDIDLNKPNTALSLKVPDTITTWIVRAFSVNDDTGFGMMDGTLDIQAFQPFFISVTLPYSVKRGEVVTIPVTIFNYLRENLKTEVTLENNYGDFEFVDEQNKALAKRQDTRNANVPGNNGKSVVFNISPKKLGNIELRIIAKNAITSDGVSQKLKVEPEGIVQNHNQDVLLTLENDSTNKTSFQAAIPANIVPESEYLVLSVSGDIMVSTLENLDKLVAKPYGCGEQNMINLAPNILILDYLKSLGKLKNQTELVDRAKNFIQTGYQQELTYRHPNGAYSVFGPKSSTENNWLTAYVTRFFIKGIKYSAIEPRIIEQGLEYLSSQQLDDGSFPHRGYLFDPAHQNQYGFTAFVMLTFLEDEIYSKKYGNVIGKGMNFLRKNIDNIQDTYSLAILANALQKSGSSEANDILGKLKAMAMEENGLKWWTNNNKKEQSANDVEITSYVLMALLEHTPTSAYLPIFNWLIKQRNSQGGFGSTQDTVVGLQALIKYAMKSSQTPDTKVKVHYLAKSDKGEIVKENVLLVDSNNELVLQKEELPRTTRSVDVMVMGSGRVYLQLSHQYYIANQSNQPTSTPITMPGLLSPPSSSFVEHKYFSIKPKARMTSTMTMSLEICYTYRPFTEEEKLTNMVILEVQFPSGFTSNGENIESLQDEEYISRIDNQNSATKLSIYFEKLEANEEQCLIILGDKGHDVAGLKASPIEMYDFYNGNRRSTILYELSK